MNDGMESYYHQYPSEKLTFKFQVELERPSTLSRLIVDLPGNEVNDVREKAKESYVGWNIISIGRIGEWKK